MKSGAKPSATAISTRLANSGNADYRTQICPERQVYGVGSVSERFAGLGNIAAQVMPDEPSFSGYMNRHLPMAGGITG